MGRPLARGPPGGEGNAAASLPSPPSGRSRLRPDREGGARLADPPGALEIS